MLRNLILVIGLFLLPGLWQCVSAQNAINGQSNASATLSSNGTSRLFSIVGQPVAVTGASVTNTQAGLLSIASYVSVDNAGPVISYSNSNQGIIAGSSNSLSVTITDNIVVATAKLFYRPIAAPSFTDVIISGTSNSYTVALDDSWSDAMGMEYYFTATDGSSNTDRSPKAGSYYAYKSNTSVIIPQLTSGTDDTNYHIIAMPYTSAQGDDISRVFGVSSGLPEYSNTKWRLATYDNAQGKFKEAPASLTKFERGRGYWFITKAWPSGGVTLGANTAPSNNRGSLYSMTLKPGWNQVGNPYPVSIKWTDVLAMANNNTIGSIKVYDGGWSDGDEMAAFQGAFVKVTGDKDVTIKIPFVDQTSEGGRVSGNDVVDTTVDSWRIPVHVFQGNRFSKLGAFGMDSNAKFEEDRLDDFNPPAFSQSPSLNFIGHANATESLSKDIVPITNEFTWHFNVTGEPGELTTLTWPNDVVRPGEIYLIDDRTLEVVDMRERSSHEFMLTPDHRFSIFVGKNINELAPNDIRLSGPFPNPSVDGHINFTLGLPDATGMYNTQCVVFSITGEMLVSRKLHLSRGIHQISVQLPEGLSKSMLVYKVTAQDDRQAKVFTGKIVVK